MNYIPVPKGLKPRIALNGYSDAGDAAKTAFHRDGKAFLRKVAKELGLQSDEYSLRSNLAGVAVSGEVTLHTDDLYVQLHESCVGAGGVSVLYRSCKSRKDCCGHTNHFAQASALAEEGMQERFMRNLNHLIAEERARKEDATTPVAA